ncbi:SPOR domain-containing protein [Marinomonas sp. C2222]|uniref:SPOR domain-containing protein n=1 Tax=Marinomonas sargassi TaxID=2984494 RepID=A0ABT2YSH7_9GAMM|nr:SPOR domain-containing protein [Marinomonas sargassi]MCV2402835.1 SPOR domain-containing protein [Marinomonas sargassi]
MIDKNITYRLIGASIIVLSAAILLPLILDGERPPELEVEVHVTEPPAFPVVEIQAVQPVESIPFEKEEAPSEQITLIPVAKVEKKSPPKSESTQAKLPEKTVSPSPVKQNVGRWVVQIATFKSKTNATNLVKKLKAEKYDAYSVTVNSLYKVYVGPEFDRSASEKSRDEIKEKFNLAGIVTKFSVN